MSSVEAAKEKNLLTMGKGLPQFNGNVIIQQGPVENPLNRFPVLPCNFSKAEQEDWSRQRLEEIVSLGSLVCAS